MATDRQKYLAIKELVSDDDVEAVAAEVGMGSNAWGCVDPREIIAAVPALVLRRALLK